MKVRDWECGCGHAWTAPVVLAKHTPNLSGEATQWCPRCHQRPVMGSPVREEGEILAALRRAHAILCAHAIELDCDAVIEEIDAVLAKATTTN